MIGVVEPAAPVTGGYVAVVTVVDRVFDAASGSFGVRLSLPNGDGALPAGHRCKVAFAPERTLADEAVWINPPATSTTGETAQ